jgi:hypothetical protein
MRVQIEKPCVTAYFSGRAWPEVGERGIRFYALVAELRRVGLTEDATLNKMVEYFNKCPESVLNAPASDGRPFTYKELESIIKAAYKGNKTKSYGCNSGKWDLTCIGPEMCHFRKQLSNGKEQSAETALFSFLFDWLKKDKQGKFLYDSDVRVYLALCMVEKRRAYKPGSPLFVSWKELADLSGVSRQNIGNSLMNLFWAGLIAYQKGIAQQRGTASEVRRVIPVPKPNRS